MDGTQISVCLSLPSVDLGILTQPRPDFRAQANSGVDALHGHQVLLQHDFMTVLVQGP
jgi:hypothetical protein